MYDTYIRLELLMNVISLLQVHKWTANFRKKNYLLDNFLILYFAKKMHAIFLFFVVGICDLCKFMFICENNRLLVEHILLYLYD